MPHAHVPRRHVNGRNNPLVCVPHELAMRTCPLNITEWSLTGAYLLRNLIPTIPYASSSYMVKAKMGRDIIIGKEEQGSLSQETSPCCCLKETPVGLPPRNHCHDAHDLAVPHTSSRAPWSRDASPFLWALWPCEPPWPCELEQPWAIHGASKNPNTSELGSYGPRPSAPFIWSLN